MTQGNVVAELEESRRAALVAYHLGHMEDAARHRLTTPEDLYEYLLVDPMVSAAVDASEVTMAVASLQQYVHAITAGMEPGYTGLLDAEGQRDWRDRRGQYALWAANQMLQNYPENYLDPSLRLRQTSAFGEFVNQTNQGRISKDSVRTALMNYVDAFETVANLTVVSGYCDRSDIRNADYYFIGRTRVQPTAYYWRKLEVRLVEPSPAGDDPVSARIPASAWTEWEKIGVSPSGVVEHIRPVFFNGRLCVAWLERSTSQETSVGSGGDFTPAKTIDTWAFRLAWRTHSGQWSTPMSWDIKGRPGPMESWGTPDAMPFAAFAWNEEEGDRKIVLAARDDKATPSPWRFVCVDELFNVVASNCRGPVDAAAEPAVSFEAVVEAALTSYGPADAVVQIAPDEVEGLTRIVSERRRSGPWGGGMGMKLIAYPSSTHHGQAAFNAKGWSSFLHLAGSELELRITNADKQWSKPVVKATGIGFNLATTETSWFLGRPFDKAGETFAGSLTISFQGVEYGRLEVDCAMVKRQGAPETPQVITLQDGSQFLDVGLLEVAQSHIRMTTRFGKYLVERATRSVDALLDWDTQHLPEGLVPEGAVDVSDIMDFNGANGRYFWELFFHMPHMVAWRLHQEFRYADAQEWLHYIFNPQARYSPATTANPEYWSVRPLSEPGDLSHEFDGLVDPDAICYAAPVHYRKAIFTFYVRNLVAMGDERYRRLTRDSLNEAKLAYVRALSLMGPMPDNRMIGRWEPRSLQAAAEYDGSAMAGMEGAAPPAVAWGAPAVDGTPWLDLLDADYFRVPLNTMLLGLWDDIGSRLDHLRHHLTIDGKPIMIPLYDSPADPMDLLRAQSSSSGLFQRGVGSLASIPPYRFRGMLPRAQEAVATLIRFGDDVRIYRELKDRAHQEELQQKHLQELSTLAVGLSEVLLTQSTANVAALQASRDIAARRAEMIESFLEDTSVHIEIVATSTAVVANELRAAESAAFFSSIPLIPTATIVTAVGGGNSELPEAPVRSAMALAAGVEMATMAAELMFRSAEYGRRAKQWKHDADLARMEAQAIDKQIDALRLSIDYSTRQLQHARKVQAQAEEYHAFLKTRSTNEGLYQWLVAQMSTLYFQAYDAVVALCLSTEAAWQYEMGDYQSRFVQPDVWFDNYHGLTAGSSLKLQLMRMESAHLKRNERRLELVRNISLKALFDEWLKDDGPGGEAAMQELVNQGELQFALPEAFFDHDYPGHYLRQIVSVSVSLPLVVGAYQDVKATLTQVSSTTVLKADIEAVKHLYDPDTGTPTALLYNPRVSQSVGLSHGVDDAGMHVVNFYDERYLPFEGTGAVSRWLLRFPRHDKSPQEEMLATLNDVILRVSYTALDGGPQFAAAVEKLVDAAMV